LRSQVRFKDAMPKRLLGRCGFWRGDYPVQKRASGGGFGHGNPKKKDGKGISREDAAALMKERLVSPVRRESSAESREGFRDEGRSRTASLRTVRIAAPPTNALCRKFVLKNRPERGADSRRPPVGRIHLGEGTAPFCLKSRALVQMDHERRREDQI